MTAEPTYEYRVVNALGETEWMTSEQLARDCAATWNQWGSAEAKPWRIQRRLVTPWGDVPDGK